MAEETKNTSLISKTNTGFPDYLDFDKLRSEGIDYLGRLSGKIWTDHNVHDPGITILDILCYALLDLGYRTNLPPMDIFAPDPDAPSAENNFFTPAQILTCNPLTIMDFRKLLIDIEGVKNAWLEVATDEKDFCRKRQEPPPNPEFSAIVVLPPIEQTSCNYLNGLYHVYIDLEKDVEKEFKGNNEGKTALLDDISSKVKDALMAHRNLCEDFIDISILCKQEIGVCADIELEENTDAEQVYLAVVEALRDFISPAPRFYTLQQMLNKGKTIDEVFAGRPYNITESHGFTITEELKQLSLRKEIHLSDVYHAIFNVEGVKSVNNLKLQACNGGPNSKDWKYKIPKNHVLEFSMECSGFRFTRNESPVNVDFQKFEGLFSIGFTQNGKVQYQIPSPYLDMEIPQGSYHNELADYFSIQNEFPQVYGIAEGGLSENASNERKAKALQLKSWLLFFDQLLANYLSQLKNIRSLFAMSSSEGGDNHTYFINQLTTVPNHQKLVRFNINENNENVLGTKGSILAIPVKKKTITNLAAEDKLKAVSLENFDSYPFHTLAAQHTAIEQLRNDLYFEQYRCEYVVKDNECVFYYILTSSDEIALVSTKYFKDINEAKTQAASLQYMGTFDENYRSVSTKANTFSFDIELNLFSFSKYLQLIVEDEQLFHQRRQKFLNHLLSRFAEGFTDYALLAFGFGESNKLAQSEIDQKEKYLMHYPDLSSNRGRAYDYLENNWNTKNLSGFEKKVKSLSGMDNGQRRSLCNFEVAKYDKQFEVILKIAGTTYFSVDEKFDSKEKGKLAAQALFNAMKERNNYRAEYIVHDKTYKLVIRIGDEGYKAEFPITYDKEKEALETAARLSGLFVKKNPEEAVFISDYIFTPELKDSSGEVIRRSLTTYPDEDEAQVAALKTIKKIDNRKQWQFDANGPKLGHMQHISYITEHLSFINTKAFKIDINNTIIDKPDVFTYDILDHENTFKFSAVNEFKTAHAARNNAYDLLALLANASNYQVFQDKQSKEYHIRIRSKNGVQAISSVENNSKKEALVVQKKVLEIIKKHQYSIGIEKQPHRWRFNYQLGYEKGNLQAFESAKDYTSRKKALQASSLFIDTDPAFQLKKTRSKLSLSTKQGSKNPVIVNWISSSGSDSTVRPEESIGSLIAEKTELEKWSKKPNIRNFENSVFLDENSKQERFFAYRLIDKDRIPAFYTKPYNKKRKAKTEIKTLSNQFQDPAGYLQICMGGAHVVHKIKDRETNRYWYHYQVRSINQIYQGGDLAGRPLVLFESTKGYESAEEAEKAFQEEYLYIIYLASKISNYEKRISLTKIHFHQEDDCIKSNSIVFVPEATKEDLGKTDDYVKNKLISLAISYPIRMTHFQSEAFYKLFPCEKETDEKTNAESCKKEEGKYVYYYTLGYQDKGQQETNWQSTKYYFTPEEARKAFDFFQMLLLYPGNYFVDCDPCKLGDGNTYHIYIREVLAESTERFQSKEKAWGRDGIQKFICTAQSEESFHPYLRKRDCCYSFYVACNDSLIYHPCKYDSPKKRDEVLLNLYQALKEQIKNKSWFMEVSGQDLVLFNESGKEFAKVASISDNNCRSDQISFLSEYANKIENYKKDDTGKIILTNGKKANLAISVDEGITKEDWKKDLQTFLCRYPIVKTENGDDSSYCIEIKLPRFNTCTEDLAEDEPCGCGKENQKSDYDCHIAWKSRCCYESCWEAERELQTFLKLLQQFSFYQPVFDCDCKAYGIALNFEKNLMESDNNTAFANNSEDINGKWKNSEIVATNPQCYPCKEDVCEAVDRAKKLINSEGLHLVEHILLRPRCAEDCDCQQRLQFCDKTGCKFEWEVPDKDPCAEEKDICFVPGADPYSFITTVALPAWPERFRKIENRELLENIIYREAPAHVLVRILWLAPQDYCGFESKYKSWNRWLAQKKTCIDDFSTCDFLEFLFDRNYECLAECDVCHPCQDTAEQEPPCFAESEDKTQERDYLNQINDLYCWKDLNCNDLDQSPRDENPELTVNREQPEPRFKSSLQSATGEGTSSLRRKPQVINARLMNYKKGVEKVTEKSKNNHIAVKAQRFLTDPNPSYDRMSKLGSEILQNKRSKAKSRKLLTKTQKLQLIENIICYWLDRNCFNGKDRKELGKLNYLVKKLNKAKVKPERIYTYWNFTEIKQVEPELKEDYFKGIFYGSSD